VVVPGSRHLGCLFNFWLFDHELRLGLFLLLSLFHSPQISIILSHVDPFYICIGHICFHLFFSSPNFSDVCLMFCCDSMPELELVTSLMLRYRGVVMCSLISYAVCSLEAVWVYFLWTVMRVFSYTCGCFVVFLVSSLTPQPAFVT